MTDHLLALDQGTTSSRAIVFDRGGRLVTSAQREFTQVFPRPGWVEHDPEEIWQTQSAVADEALEQAGLTAKDIAAVGIANQRETVVVWERASGRPIHSAIVWQDRRTADICERHREDGLATLVRDQAGLEIDPYFSATKVAWILDHIDGARVRAERGELCFGTIDSWLLWKLTEGRVHATDASNASRTMLFDIHQGQWSDRLCEALRVPPAILPEVRDTAGDFGEITAAGSMKGLHVHSMVGDQQGATFGQLCLEPGLAKNTYGTGCFLLAHTGAEAVSSTHRLLTTVAWQLGGKLEYAFEGAVFVGGAVVQWLRDGLGVIEHASEIQDLARSVPDTAGVVVVPAFAGLGAPHWDPHARGSISGLTRGVTKAHIARAALEGIALQVADLADAIAQDMGRPVASLRVDGGAAANDLLMQMQADLGQCAVDRPALVETTAVGAALLAGVGAGVFEEISPDAAVRKVDRVFEPLIRGDEAAARRALWRRGVERALNWAD